MALLSVTCSVRSSRSAAPRRECGRFFISRRNRTPAAKVRFRLGNVWSTFETPRNIKRLRKGKNDPFSTFQSLVEQPSPLG